MSSAYEEPISEQQPLLFVIALDPSLAATSDSVVADLNRFLYSAALRCVRGNGISNLFYVALLARAARCKVPSPASSSVAKSLRFASSRNIPCASP